MSNALRQISKACCLAGLLSTVAAGQNPTFSLEAIAVNSRPLERPTDHVTVSPGDVLTLHIFIRDWSPDGQQMRAYQAQADSEAYSSGSEGTIKPVDFETTSKVGVENKANGFIDTSNPMYVHAGMPTIAMVDTITPGYRWLSVLQDRDDSPTSPQDGTKYYVGTLNAQVSNEARGTFSLGFYEDPGSSVLRDSDGLEITPLDFERLTVEVTEGAPVLRILSSDPQTGAIDARQPLPQGKTARGLDTIDLTFNTDTATLSADDLRIEDGSANPPRIKRVESNGTTARLVLDRGIRSGVWTTISHERSNTGIRIGYLPGDVSNDGALGVQDLLALIDRPEGAEPLPLYRADIDRDGVLGITDVLRLIELLAEPNAYRMSLP